MGDSNISHRMFGLTSSSNSSRPTNLPLPPPMHNPFYHPNNYDKYMFAPAPVGYDHQGRGYTTPELLNALSSSNSFDGQTPQNTKVLEDMLNVHSNISTRPPVASTLTPPMMYGHQSMRHRSISSSMHDQESSNSTLASSPYSTNPTGDELQNVPSAGRKTSPESGGDDVVRKEKKRERNRQAAQKCRTRKLTRIAELQKRVNELQGKNRDLSGLALNLKNEVSRLERQLEDHRTRGCTLLSNGYPVAH